MPIDPKEGRYNLAAMACQADFALRSALGEVVLRAANEQKVLDESPRPTRIFTPSWRPWPRSG
ncbi:MAG: hypothetical protein QMC81_06250 [Thermoanaerobacterales bacterium]|nr:hypothetical protein [Bacillota bacterium]MDI6907070.1 hypothetical protein [Thermoanaerobacterales bacterium]